MGGLFGQHHQDARLAAAGAVLFAASYLVLRAVGVNFDLPTQTPAGGSESHSVGMTSSEVLAAPWTPFASPLLPAPQALPSSLP